MKGECAEVKVGEIVFSEEEKQSQLHMKNSKNGFDICCIRSNDSNNNNEYLGQNIISEDVAWQIARNMVKKHPYYYSMVYVVYFCDINNRKSPVQGYRRKAIII